ncbi:cytochrome P450 [Microdochium trichocladiopsis]|uniref:Cytochrome P450 n=1 Tax=Microdochium trichocladiopsis TaxID=1682393 RepID=A0A9P9BNG7_9PEZI|nr:cytochrome P450 [Microdochium trichocladiopsis]KAH7020863.1 cytochrome P450 [Microdochium trichocladiopsis]
MALSSILLHPAGAALVTLALSLFLYLASARRPRITRSGQALRKPPGTVPILGNGLIFLRPRHKLFDWFSRCEQHFGLETFEISVPTLPPGVVINNPENLDYVFKNEALFQKGDLFRQLSWDLFGNGIINADGALWKAQRKAGLHFLSAENLKVLNDAALPAYLGKSMRQIARTAAPPGSERDSNATVLDLQHVFHEITSQVMGKLAYDMEMHTGDEFTAAFEHASGCTTERFQNPLWFITEVFFGSKFRQSLRTIRSVGGNIVESAREKRAQTAKRDTNTADDEADKSGSAAHSGDAELDGISGSLIYSLIDTLGEDKKLVADAALNYLSAGRDTVAQALTWTMYLLMKHESATAQILEEITQLRASVATDNTRPPAPTFQHERLTQPDDDEGTYHSTAELFTPAKVPYTMAVFYESLRLYPPVPFEIKQCTAAVTLPDGTHLPQGTVIFWSPWSMNRSRAIWGPDAETFRPERWLFQEEADDSENKRLVLKTRPAAEFPVFNGGQRLCLGKKMAELMAAQIIPSLVEKFEFVPGFDVHGEERISGSSLTLPMKDGLPCVAVLRG